MSSAGELTTACTSSGQKPGWSCAGELTGGGLGMFLRGGAVKRRAVAGYVVSPVGPGAIARCAPRASSSLSDAASYRPLALRIVAASHPLVESMKTSGVSRSIVLPSTSVLRVLNRNGLV